MKLKARTCHRFLELSVDEIETTVFNGGSEVDEMIINLLDVVDDLLLYTKTRFDEEINELKQH
tara:strand:- start:203 stop:391 length:189 start_codon:yes stop_codon:yes gene_type:complete